MATTAELEAQLLAELGKGKGADAAKALLEDAPFRSDSAQRYLQLGLWSVVASGTRADLAFFGRLGARTKKAWPDTWMRTWMLEAIASASALLERLLSGPGKGSKVKAADKPHPRWLARAASLDFAELDGLLADLMDGPATQIAERAQALLPWPKDARIARAALAVHDGRLVSNPRHPIWNAAANLIAVHADASLRKALADRMVEDPLLAGPHWISAFKGGADPLARKAPVAKASGGAPQTAADWVTWVMAEPDDLQRRALWADWLLERGDPRGELLSLQLLERALTPAEQKRVAALVKKHGKTWIGKLAGVADGKTLQFERGVLVACRIGAVPEGRVAADDPHWATLTRVTVPSYTMVPKLEAKLLSLAPRLEALEDPSLAFLRKVLAAGAPKLVQLSCDLGFHAAQLDAADAALLAKAKLSALRRLRLTGQPGAALVKAIAAMPWFGQLERFVVDGGDLGERLAAVGPTGLARMDVLVAQNHGWEPDGTGFSYRATRTGAGKWKVEAVGLPERAETVPPDYFYDTHLLPSLAKLKGVGEITLVVPKGFQATPKMQRKIAAAIGRAVA